MKMTNEVKNIAKFSISSYGQEEKKDTKDDGRAQVGLLIKKNFFQVLVEPRSRQCQFSQRRSQGSNSGDKLRVWRTDVPQQGPGTKP